MSSPVKPTSMNGELLLWNRFREGDEKAFAQISRQYYRTLAHYGGKFTPNSQVIEDAIQDLLISLWVKRASLKEIESVKFYLLKSFRNQLFKNLKKFKASELDNASIEETDVVFSFEESYIKEETDKHFKESISLSMSQLPERQKEVIYLRFYQDLSVEEISQLFHIKPQSVSNVIQRALANLRESWQLTISLLLWLTI